MLFKKKRPARVVTVTRELRELSAEEHVLLNKRPTDVSIAKAGDVVLTARGRFVVM